MKIDYRRLTENELDTFINMRINQLREEGAKEDIDLVDYGCGTIQITASDMGVKLYTDFGFVHNDNFMQYKL